MTMKAVYGNLSTCGRGLDRKRGGDMREIRGKERVNKTRLTHSRKDLRPRRKAASCVFSVSDILEWIEIDHDPILR
jgi:hypothetical protein